MLLQKSFFSKTVRRKAEEWNSSIVKSIEITSKNCHTVYGKAYISTPYFIEKVKRIEKEQLQLLLLKVLE